MRKSGCWESPRDRRPDPRFGHPRARGARPLKGSIPNPEIDARREEEPDSGPVRIRRCRQRDSACSMCPSAERILTTPGLFDRHRGQEEGRQRRRLPRRPHGPPAWALPPFPRDCLCLLPIAGGVDLDSRGLVNSESRSGLPGTPPSPSADETLPRT